MFQKKAKSLFAEVSHYQVRLARTDRFSSPLIIEGLESIPVTTTGETRRAIEKFAGETRGSFCQARCCIYPRDRFLHRHQAENVARTKGDDYAKKVLSSELERDPAETVFRVLHPTSGRQYDPVENLSRETLYAGASRDCLQEEQKRLIELGIYPTRLELSSISLFAGMKRAVIEEDMDASALILELSEKSSYGYVVNLNGLAISHSIDFGISSIAGKIQEELGLQDALSARKVMLSKTFDFRDMASTLLKDLIIQVRASTGQFEVQTGKSVHYLYIPGLPASLSWISEILAEELSMEHWKPSLTEWFTRAGISLSGTMASREDLFEYLPLFCQMAKLDPTSS